VRLGCQRLGPAVTTPDGAYYTTLRDPYGAAVALRQYEPGPSDERVAWHQLHVRDAASAWAGYSELFCWVERATDQGPDVVGCYCLFAWHEGAKVVGSVGNTARWPGIHSHWLFYFAVPDIESSVVRVRAQGGTALDPLMLPGGKRLSACEDPQGAAFGLIQ